MQTIDIGAYFVAYNFVIGVLLMLSCEKLGTYSGRLSGSHSQAFARYTRLGVFTFGAAVSVISGTIYIAFHVLRSGL